MRRVAIAFFACVLMASPLAAAEEPAAGARHDMAKLEAAQKKYLATLDVKGFAADYPKVVRDLDSTDVKAKRRALNVIGASVDLRALPLVIPLLKDREPEIRTFAAITLNNVTVGTALDRRDQMRLYTIALRPRTPQDPDMRPLAAVVLQMLQQKDEPNIVSHAVVIVGYLQLYEFEPELRAFLQSSHPSVATQAAHALKVLHAEDEAPPAK